MFKERIELLKRRLSSCDLCPHGCGVDRRRGEVGFCRATDEIQIAHVGLHFGEEPPISGSRGSGTIFFTHCNARCVYCQNYQISQQPEQIPTRILSAAQLADEMLLLERAGAHNVNLISPTHVAAGVAEALFAARERGLSIPVVYNSNGYDAVPTLRCLEGLIDVYLPDIKYSQDAAAMNYSGVQRYVAANRRAIGEMYRQVGNLVLDEHGIARRGLLVRHLVLPGGQAGSRDSLRFLRSLSPDVTVSIMAQYTPQHRAAEFPPLERRISAAEYEQVVDCALALGLEQCFVQELECSDAMVPDFRKASPFEG